MQIKAEEISQILKKQIKDYGKVVEISETGSVLSVGDGIARVYGLDNVMAGELVEFGHGVRGMVLNLEEGNVGVAIMGHDTEIREGDEVRRSSEVGLLRWRSLSFSTFQKGCSPLFARYLRSALEVRQRPHERYL